VIEICEDLFAHLHEPLHVVGLSTNGTIKRDGRGVMGRGCALEASLRYPTLPLELGKHLKNYGNIPGYLTVGQNHARMRFLILPVKHHWFQHADVDLIQMSIKFLDELAREGPSVTFHVPRLGCGNGRLSWVMDVRHLMASLPDNVVVHH
jgi:hypothetical protein